MNKEKHVGMTYTIESNITMKINDPYFKDLQIILLQCFKVKEKLK
jgi:hypothetical protein